MIDALLFPFEFFINRQDIDIEHTDRHTAKTNDETSFVCWYDGEDPGDIQAKQSNEVERQSNGVEKPLICTQVPSDEEITPEESEQISKVLNSMISSSDLCFEFMTNEVSEEDEDEEDGKQNKFQYISLPDDGNEETHPNLLHNSL